jgi:hypothetical protein
LGVCQVSGTWRWVARANSSSMVVSSTLDEYPIKSIKYLKNSYCSVWI